MLRTALFNATRCEGGGVFVRAANPFACVTKSNIACQIFVQLQIGPSASSSRTCLTREMADAILYRLKSVRLNRILRLSSKVPSPIHEERIRAAGRDSRAETKLGSSPYASFDHYQRK